MMISKGPSRKQRTGHFNLPLIQQGSTMCFAPAGDARPFSNMEFVLHEMRIAGHDVLADAMQEPDQTLNIRLYLLAAGQPRL